uniref:Uncharacterized protein n=1 Tax=Anopheles atroparvus TaxID=41427 RepID=A0A182JBU9_ANOAO
MLLLLLLVVVVLVVLVFGGRGVIVACHRLDRCCTKPPRAALAPARPRAANSKSPHKSAFSISSAILLTVRLVCGGEHGVPTATLESSIVEEKGTYGIRGSDGSVCSADGMLLTTVNQYFDGVRGKKEQDPATICSIGIRGLLYPRFVRPA